ncbi:hypothetical protein A4X09_0g3839 [Tilletia walkeri]|uniref:SET domain-containing protein n=1 Tax=Tilletia walkeri TaxID=117179 RepID=A0A8X7N8I8_9BASI|nr:hypothetical protein A4X09_0g3839 [Tilletia walkeri]
MHDLSHDDDILSDILVDNLGSNSSSDLFLSTHKMNASYRSHRVHASIVRDLVWEKVIVQHNIASAVDELCTMPIVKKYIADKDSRQLHAFKLHAKRYFEAYHPECGIEFVQSTRYQRATALLKQVAARAGTGATATAGTSSTASTSAIPLTTEPSTSALTSAPTSASAADSSLLPLKPESSAPVDASVHIPVDPPTEPVPEQTVNNPPAEPTKETITNEIVDVIMADAQLTEQTPAPTTKVETPQTNGTAAITAVSTQLPDANGSASGLNGKIVNQAAPSDAMSTGTSTPTATSAVSKGKRRMTSEGSKSRTTVNHQLASSWSDPFSSLQKADMAVCAIKAYKEGDFIDFLKGGVKDLTREEDETMKREAHDARQHLGPGQIAATAAPARDFSVIRSAQKGCSQLLLGPARFVNHDCNPNVEFYRAGQSITFRCMRPIMPRDEITCYYGPNYFEWENAECLCATCEANGKGAFSVLAGLKLATGAGASHAGSPDLAVGAEGDMPGYSPGPDGSASSVNSAHGSEASSNGVPMGITGSRRSSARVAMVQATGRSRRMTPGGVPFPSMSLAPTSASRRPSPSAETNGSSASAAEVEGGIGLGVSMSSLSPGAEGVLGAGALPIGASGPSNNVKLLRLSCPTCHNRFECLAKWCGSRTECHRCERHRLIYREPWPTRMGHYALERRQMHLERRKSKKDQQERKAGDADGGERAPKKAKVSKKRSEPTPIRLYGEKQSNGKGKEKAVNNGTGISPAASGSVASGSTDSMRLTSDSDSDSDLTELESEDEVGGMGPGPSSNPAGPLPSTSGARDFEREVEDADTTLGGGVGGFRAEAVLSVAGQSSGGGVPDAIQGGSGAPLLEPNPSKIADAAAALSPDKAGMYADYKSRYGPTGKAARTTLDFQARRREKAEPPGTADDERRRSSRTKKSRKPLTGNRSSARESGVAKAAKEARRKSRAEGGGEDVSSSSSSRESSPAGPPVLGKDANLQNLAGFWGATDSERRVRRPVFSGGVTSLLERQRAESAAKRRAREREEAKAERRRKADRRRKSGGGGGGSGGEKAGAVVKMEKAKEDVKPARARRSESPVKPGHQSLDSVLAVAGKSSRKMSSSVTSSRKSMEVLQPLRSSNRQALKRDRMLAVGTDDADDDEEDEDGGDEDSDEDDDFDDESDITSTDDDLDEEEEEVGGAGKEGEQKEGGEGKARETEDVEMGSSKSVGRPRSNGKRSKRDASSDDGSSDDSDGSGQPGSRRRRQSTSSSQTNSKKKRYVFSRSSSPMPHIPGLATKGPERTSNANLALAWSAGVADGAKRTRKPVQREPIAVRQASGARRSPSMSLSVGPGAGAGARRLSSSSSLQPESPGNLLHPLPSPANPPVPGFRRPASPANPPVLGFRRPASPAVTSLSIVPPVGAGGGAAGSSSSSSGAGAAGPSANRSSGAPRRNLRWGSGKVTHSRPSPLLAGGGLPGRGSTSPVGGPGSSSGGAPRSTTTPASFVGGPTSRPMGGVGAIGVKVDPGARVGSGSPAGSPLSGVVGGRVLGPPPLPPMAAASASASAAAARAAALLPPPYPKPTAGAEASAKREDTAPPTFTPSTGTAPGLPQ